MAARTCVLVFVAAILFGCSSSNGVLYRFELHLSLSYVPEYDNLTSVSSQSLSTLMTTSLQEALYNVSGTHNFSVTYINPSIRWRSIKVGMMLQTTKRGNRDEIRNSIRENIIEEGEVGRIHVIDDEPFYLQELGSSSCLYPGSRINSRTNLDDRHTRYVQNVVAEYECDKGFTLYGPQTRICQEPGQWSGQTPFCGLRLPDHIMNVESVGIEDERYYRDRDFTTCSSVHPRQYSDLNISLTLDLNVDYDVRMIELYTNALIADRKSLLVKASATKDGLLTAQEVEAPLPPGQGHDNNRLTVYKVFLPANVKGRFIQVDVLGSYRNESYGICEIFTVIEYGTPENFCINEEFRDGKHYQIGDKCYQFTDVQEVSYENAQLYCKQRHAELPHGIDDGSSLNLRMVARDHFENNNITGNYVWVAGEKIGSTWKWSSGEDIDSRVLPNVEDTRDYSNHNCMVMNKTNHWLFNYEDCERSSAYIVCQHNRTRCGHPPQSERALMTVSDEDKIGRMAQFSCPDGYIIQGAENVQCGHDGFWNHQSPTCVKSDAPKKIKGSGVLAGMLAGIFLGAIMLAMCVFFIRRHLARRRKENISGKVTKLSSKRLDSTDRRETEPCLTKQEIIEEK